MDLYRLSGGNRAESAIAMKELVTALRECGLTAMEELPVVRFLDFETGGLSVAEALAQERASGGTLKAFPSAVQGANAVYDGRDATIYLKRDRSTSDLRRAVRHEVAHHAQQRRFGRPPSEADRAAREQEALVAGAPRYAFPRAMPSGTWGTLR
jgi:hypothetical protein